MGIGKDKPVGLWVCETCRSIPQTVKDDVIYLKNDVEELKESTDTILSAVYGLSTQLENCFSGFQDQITALSRQIKCRAEALTKSVETSTNTTNAVKSAFEAKTNQIVNKANTIIEKVKSQTDIVKSTLNKPNVTPQTVSVKSNANHQESNDKLNNNKSAKQTLHRKKQKYKNVSPETQSLTKFDQKSKQAHNSNSNKINENETIDLTTETKKKITQSTLLVGSSLFKGIKNSDLKLDTTVRSFPGAKIDTIGESISKYDITNCETVILHVGGNDADNGINLNTFSENYVSLLNTLDAENRRIIVSGLLPRESVDLKSYNQKLKDICKENDIEFIDNYDTFLLATGEMPESYFHADKLHLNASGTKRLLSNIHKVHNICRNSKLIRHSYGPRTQGKTIKPNGTRGPSSLKFCHICSRTGHFTRDCWYNGRNAPHSVYSSW